MSERWYDYDVPTIQVTLRYAARIQATSRFLSFFPLIDSRIVHIIVPGDGMAACRELRSAFCCVSTEYLWSAQQGPGSSTASSATRSVPSKRLAFRRASHDRCHRLSRPRMAAYLYMACQYHKVPHRLKPWQPAEEHTYPVP